MNGAFVLTYVLIGIFGSHPSHNVLSRYIKYSYDITVDLILLEATIYHVSRNIHCTLLHRFTAVGPAVRTKESYVSRSCEG